MQAKIKIVNWKLEEAVATDCNVSYDKANTVIKLINDGSTIPFIARYRKECTGNLPPATLHKIKEKMEECKYSFIFYKIFLKLLIRTVIENVEKSIKSIEKTGQLTENVKEALQNCKTMDDVAFVVMYNNIFLILMFEL